MQEKLFIWRGIFPPYPKTSVSIKNLQSVKRSGNLVKVSIKDQDDVGFQCSRLTDAIVLATGLNCIIREAGA